MKLTLQRDVDSALFGHENPLRGDYRIAVGTGTDADGNPDPHSLGRLLGMHAELYVDAGNTADCTPIVLDCVQLRFDNAYMIPNYRTSGKVCLTNTTSNTSFRSLDAISGITILEDGIEAAAHELGLLPEDVRVRNLYRLGDATPYGEILDNYYLPDVWKYAAEQADFEHRLAAVQAFNRANRWVKRGISMIPIQYGMGFNTAFLEQRRRPGRHLRRRRHGDRAPRRRRDRAGDEHPGDPAGRPRAEHPDAPRAHRHHLDRDHPQPGGHRRQHRHGVQRRCRDEGGADLRLASRTSPWAC